MPNFITSDGCRLFYEIRTNEPQKPFVAFLNGFTQTTVYWYGLVPTFLKRFSIILYDARGQGRSEPGERKPTLEQHVHDLAELLTQLNVRRTHLVGLSHGARVALAYAAARPGDIDRLVLCGLGAQDSRRTRQLIDSWHAVLEAGDTAAMAEAILPSVFGGVFFEKHKGIMADIAAAVVERNHKDALLAQLKALPDYPAPENAQIRAGIACLVLSGEDDLLTSPAEAADLARHLDAGHIVLENVGHSLPVEAPERFQRLVQDFLLPLPTDGFESK